MFKDDVQAGLLRITKNSITYFGIFFFNHTTFECEFHVKLSVQIKLII